MDRSAAPAPPSPGGWGGGATGGWREVPKTAISRLVAAVEANPGRAFVIFAVGHAALWTLLPALLCRNLPLDVIEGIAYGQEWQIGYWKHPPLPWWLVDIARDLGGPRLWPLFLLGQLAAVVCFWAVWRLGCRLLRPVEALVAVVLLDGCVVFTIPTMEFNHNIVQLPIWGLVGWTFHRALVERRWPDWMLLGLWLALAFYAKYAAVTLVAPLLLFTLVEGRARQCWRTPGPYLAVLVFLAVLGPHLAWLVRNDFSPVVFASGRAEKATGLGHLAYLAGDTVVSALSLIAPAFLLFAALIGRRVRASAGPPLADAFARRYVVALALGPFATAVITSVLMGRGSHRGGPRRSGASWACSWSRCGAPGSIPPPSGASRSPGSR